MERPSIKFVIVRDKDGAAVLVKPLIFNTVEDARHELKAIAQVEFSEDSGYVTKWLPEDKVEFSNGGLPEPLVYTIQAMSLCDVYTVVVNVPFRIDVKAQSLKDAEEEALLNVKTFFDTNLKIRDALRSEKYADGIYRNTWIGFKELPVTIVHENNEGRQYEEDGK